jgi:hypothetical protein
MRCDNARENLNASLDRELTWPARLALRAHLLHCPACRAEAGRLKALAEQLTALPAPPSQEATREVVLAAAREGVPAARPARSRRAWALAVVTLAALGFVPFPAGSARGAFARALATTDRSPGIHLTGRIWGPSGEWRFEQWFSQDGFARYDLLDGDRVVLRSLDDPGMRFIYPKIRETEVLARYDEVKRRKGTQSPPGGVWHSVPLIGPEVHLSAAPGPRSDALPPVERRQPREPIEDREFWQKLDDERRTLEVRTEERQSYTLWGGKRYVADIYGHHKEVSWADYLVLGGFIGPVYAWLGPGEDVWVHMESDPQTGLILALEQYKRIDGRWQPVYRVDSIEHGVEFGDDVRRPDLPAHHIELVDNWWPDRLGQTLAVRGSEDWQVTLRSLEANREGELFLTLSRRAKTAVTQNSRDQDNRPVPASRTLFIEARDDLGTRYAFAPAPIGNGPTLPRRLLGTRKRVIPLVGGTESHVRLMLAPESARVPRRMPRAVTIRITNEPAKSIPELTGVTSLPTADFDAFEAWFEATYYQTVTFSGVPLPPAQPGDDLIGEAISRTER